MKMTPIVKIPCRLLRLRLTSLTCPCYSTRLVIFCLFLSLPWRSALAQNRMLTGWVQDGANQVLPFATVRLLHPADSVFIKGAVTDTTGAYTLNQLDSIPYVLSVQMVGYQSYYSAPFTIGSQSALPSVIHLLPSATQLTEVVVSASKPVIELNNGMLTMNVMASPILQNGTAQDVLRKAPGVVIDENGSISLKGKTNVLIYLDGKPTYLSNTDLQRLLQSTPAQNVEKMEIMDNPSARFDASGNAGIINIVRRKSADKGFNGTANLNGGYGRYAKFSPGTTLNYRGRRVNLFGDYSYSDYQSFTRSNLFRLIPFTSPSHGSGQTSFNQYTYRTTELSSHNFHTGLDWSVGPSTTIGAVLSGNTGHLNAGVDGRTALGGTYDNPYNRLITTGSSRETWRNLTYTVNGKQKIGAGGILTVDADYAQWRNTSGQANDTDYYLNTIASAEPSLGIRTDTRTQITIAAAKTDYSQPVWHNGTLETGLKSSRVTTDNKFEFATLIGRQLIRDTLRSNQFRYSEAIQAAYVDMSKPMGKKWHIKAGLRMEYTRSNGHSVTLDSSANRHYLNLFPNVSLSYKPSDAHNLSVAYSRRIDRPNYGNLNPFEQFIDRFTYLRGNPFLRPQYTQTYSLAYGYREQAFLTLNHTHTTDAITNVLQQNEATQTTYQTAVNLERINYYSASLVIPLPIVRRWTLNTNLTGFYTDIRSPFSEGGQIQKSRLGYTLRTQNIVSLPNSWKIEVTGTYNSLMLVGIFERSRQGQLDLGFSKAWGRFRLQTSLDDVFNSMQSLRVVRQGDINTTIRNKWETRVLRINMIYQFGDGQLRRIQSRTNASDELLRRSSKD